MVWMGDGQYRMAAALITLFNELRQQYPSSGWQDSAQTGTIGDAAHRGEGSASDHNPWENNTVRALDIAADVAGCPPGEALFQMVNRMYAARDPRVYPNGYAIYNGRITDWDNPGGYHAQQGDPHLYHAHISVSQNPAGYNSTAPWPLGESALGSGTPITSQEDDMTPEQAAQLARIDNFVSGIGVHGTGTGAAVVNAAAVKANAAAVLTGQVLALVSKQQPATVDVDTDAVAAAIADSLDDDLAAKVADVLAARLKA